MENETIRVDAEVHTSDGRDGTVVNLSFKDEEKTVIRMIHVRYHDTGECIWHTPNEIKQ